MERSPRRKACAPEQAKRKHRAKNPIPEFGTPERIEYLRNHYQEFQEKLQKKKDSLDDLAFGPATYPIVLKNGSVAGRVEADERSVLCERDAEKEKRPIPKKESAPSTVESRLSAKVQNLEKLSISSRIFLLRKHAGWSIWAAAKMARLSRQAWGALEKGRSKPSAGTAIRIAKLFNVNVMLLIDEPAKPEAAQPVQ